MIFPKILGQLRTVKFRLARPCCVWCNEQTKGIDKQIQSLEQRTAELEKSFVADRSLTMIKLKMETALQLFNHAVNDESKRDFFISDPTVLARMFAASVDVVERVMSRPQTTSPTPDKFEEIAWAVDRASFQSAPIDRNGHRNGA